MPEIRHLPSTNNGKLTLCGNLREGLNVSLNRITCGLCVTREQEMVAEKTAELIRDMSHKAANATNIDEKTSKYAQRLQEIYDTRTAGDHTFYGVLTDFLRALTEEN